MKAKWYIGTFIFIFTVLGVVNHNQIPEPNQELVLHFTRAEVSVNETENTIASVKKQLEYIGAENIQVEKRVTGELKITYYSHTNAANVKQRLSDAGGLVLENTSTTSNRKPVKSPSKKKYNYNFDVFEINKQDAGTGFGGTCALETKSDYNRFYMPIVSVSTNNSVVNNLEPVEKETYKFQRYIAVAIDNNSHKIPEVRAGPKC